jgi:energy-coupling factor transporter ATP-binding protein EcfA2
MLWLQSRCAVLSVLGPKVVVSVVNEFFGFTPDAFEQYVRALSLCVFGPGVTAFGNGPDGGREATFFGTVPYPHPPTDQWSGYGVIQAKCKERRETADRDQTWALSALADELRCFADPGRGRRKPDYYIFVTNVELSSAQGGGRDKARQILDQFGQTLPLQGSDIWDANQLRALMDTYPELRRRFLAFLTDGDILGAFLDSITEAQENKRDVLVGSLERELRADAACRLDQAGSRSDEQLQLAALFFDLPASPTPDSAPPGEPGRDPLPNGVLYSMLQDASRKLDPTALLEVEESLARGETSFPTRYVLLGGPGSGKSTISQCLAQIHRSATLRRLDPARLEPQARQIIHDTYRLCEQEHLPWPATPRYPLRVDLNRFAKALTSQKSPRVTLMSYLAEQIGAGRKMSAEDLRSCMDALPWMLILDGLDEVPPSSNRSEVVAAVADFLADVRRAGADLFVLLTSRHHGYAGELGDGTVAVRHILPLSSTRALKYVERYAVARFGTSDPNKARDIVERLSESSARDLTAQLMVTPLQVTFMATVVAARGAPAEDRWQLYDSYYRTVYDRETQKAVLPYAEVLGRHQSLIDRLHHDVGFWLQYRGEVGGNTASLPIASFEKLVDRYLAEMGQKGEEKERLAGLIADAARQRLVFLTSRVEGELSFDVRALQEYMAAECLTSGAPVDIGQRLRAIAVAPYWRNALLFAASKCFSSAGLRHMQGAIGELCTDLNRAPNPLVSATKAGSELALDILQSGAVREHHSHAEVLASIALALLDRQLRIPLDGFAQQLQPTIDKEVASVYSATLAPVYRETLERKLDEDPVGRALPAWMTLTWLVDEHVDWARELAEDRWPLTERASAILSGLPGDCLRTDWLLAKGASAALKQTPSRVFDLCPWLLRSRDNLMSPLSTYLGAAGLWRTLLWGDRIEAQLMGSQGRLAGLSVSAVRAGRWHEVGPEPQAVTFIPPAWMPYALASVFVKAPTPDSLASVLELCAKRGWLPLRDELLTISLPWQLAACLDVARSPEDLYALAAAARAGLLGDASAWNAAEDRWTQKGISLPELIAAVPSGASAVERAQSALLRPVAAWYSVGSGRLAKSELREILDASLAAERGSQSRMLAWMFLAGVRDMDSGICSIARPPEMRQLFERSRARSIDLDPSTLGNLADAVPQGEWLTLLDWIGRSDKLGSEIRQAYSHKPSESAWCEALQRALIGALTPRRLPVRYRFWGRRAPLGLLRILGRWAAAGHRVDLIPCGILDRVGSDDPRFQLAALLVRLSQADYSASHAAHLADRVVSVLTSSPEPNADRLIAAALGTCLRTSGQARHVLPPLLLRMEQRLVERGQPVAAACRELLCQFRQSEASELQVGGMLARLNLPTLDEDEQESAPPSRLGIRNR